MNRSLGTFRAVYTVALASLGSFVLGYDVGVVGGVLTLSSFQRDYGYTTQEKTQVNSNCASLLQGGAFFGCFLAWPITSRLGRRWAIVASALVFCLGAILQVLNTHSLGVFYAGRIVAGLGTGASSVIIPIYTAEIAPKQIRGKLGGFFQLFVTFGIAVSYWIDYTVAVVVPSSSNQWQIAIGLQLVPGVILGVGMFFVAESPRWLIQKGRIQEAYAALVWIRGNIDDVECQTEFREILAGVNLELRVSEGVTWKAIFLPSNRSRIFMAIALQAAQQCTGNTSLAHFAPQIFAAIGAGNNAVFVSGFYGIVKIAGVVFFITFLVERIGRRKPFMAGALVMGSFMLIIAVLVAVHQPQPNADSIDAFGAAAISMVYLEAFSFNWSWGPLVWLYIAEIFPPSIREIGNATGSASQWLFNFFFSQITPHAIIAMGWGTFVMYALLNYAIFVYAFLCVRETRGKSLEEMEDVFGAVSARSVDSRKHMAPPQQATENASLVADYE